MPFYASTYAGTGTEDDPFRPLAGDRAEAAGLAWRAIDLRPDCTVAVGRALAWVPQPGVATGGGVTLLANTQSDTLSAGVRTAIGNALGVTVPAGTTFRQLVRRLLTVDTNGWNPVHADRVGRFRITLGDYTEEWTV